MQKAHRLHDFLAKIPFDLTVAVAYVVVGVLWSVWHPAWLMFLLIPIWHSFLEALEKRSLSYFAFPVLITVAYLILGFAFQMWHPGWLIFLAIPLFYAFANAFHSHEDDGDGEDEKAE